MSARDNAKANGTEVSEASIIRGDGLVAFFDILGYSKIARSNDENKIWEVIRIIKGAFDDAKGVLDSDDLRDETRSLFVGSDFSEVRCVNVSDSLVFFMPFGDSQKAGDALRKFAPQLSAMDTYRFIRYCRKVYGVLLEQGLPSRGAISYGRYYSDGVSMVAGDPVVDAHVLSDALSFSGLVLTEDAGKRLRDSENPLFKPGFCCDTTFIREEMQVLVKGKSGDELRKLDVIMPDQSFFKMYDLDADMRRLFEMHGKKIDSPRTHEILKNTINIIKTAIMENDLKA